MCGGGGRGEFQTILNTVSKGSLIFHFLKIILILNPWSTGKAQGGKDIVMFISHSGSTQECVTAAKHLVAKGVTTLCLTGRKG